MYLSSIACWSVQVVVRNLIDLLEAHGFVPNGSRLYYLNRRCMHLTKINASCKNPYVMSITVFYKRATHVLPASALMESACFKVHMLATKTTEVCHIALPLCAASRLC